MAESLRDILEAAARGVFPAADGGVTVVPQHGERDAGVIAFTAHSVVFTDEAEGWVRETLGALDCDPLAAAMHPRFLTALAARTGRAVDTVDVLLTGAPLPGRPEPALEEVADAGHPRVVSAGRRRDGVRGWTVDGGVLVLGRGVAGRLEVAVEVAEGARHRGLGRRLVAAARRLAGGEPVWAQVAAGNARSLRAFQAAG
ncbi:MULTISPECIES: GNAT family N-acetyltransferase [Streptomyces rochei group]|nr:GNAT family N-acetyltransferase [Streptomyces vinaceusdrappus]GHC38616.1 N-acetyltransferase [Streptomyces vinaceusdrappus]